MARTRVRGKVQGEGETKREPSELKDVVASIRKTMGEGSVRSASELRQPLRLSTGVFTLDMALCGGIPRNKLSGFSGSRHSGKTTVMLKTVAAYQARFPDETCVLVDAEHTYDPVWGAVHGIDNERLLVVQPDTGEQAVDMVQAFVSTLEVGLVCLDSIAALVPFKTLESSAEDNATPGIHAKLTTQLVAKVNSALLKEAKRKHYPTLLATNQWRAKIGGWAPPGQEALGSPGGKAYEHYLSTNTIFKNREHTGKDEQGFEMLEYNEHSFRIDKNKFNAGIRAGEFQMRRTPDPELGLDIGQIDDASTMLATAKKMGVYSGGGRSWKLEVPDIATMTFGNSDEAAKFLYESRNTEEDVHRALRNHLIALHATKLGMPQYFIDSIYEM